MSRRANLLFAAFTALAMLPAGTVSAAQVTGQQLLSLCTANMGGQGNPLEAAECMGFIVGVADTFDCVESNHGFTWNSSANVGQPRLVYLVVEWLHKHPDAVAYEGHRVVGAALQDAFPCNKIAAN